MKASPMTLMLASVSGPQDAEIAIAHGADIIDLRDPDGAFAPVPPDIVRATVAAVNGTAAGERNCRAGLDGAGHSRGGGEGHGRCRSRLR